MRILAAIAVVLGLSATGAGAQTITVNPPISPLQGSPHSRESVIRITSVFRTPLALIPTQTVPDAQTEGTARRALYVMAGDECAVLSEIFQGECRLGSLQIAVPFAGPGNPVSNVMTATAVYELRLRVAAAGR
jgi:hypothetical protein